MGQDCDILGEVCSWVNRVSKIPVWAKMTPNITHIEDPARAALKNGCEGIAAINTILSVMGVDLKTEEDRRMHELLQNDGAMMDWIAVPNFLDAYK